MPPHSGKIARVEKRGRAWFPGTPPPFHKAPPASSALILAVSACVHQFSMLCHVAFTAQCHEVTSPIGEFPHLLEAAAVLDGCDVVNIQNSVFTSRAAFLAVSMREEEQSAQLVPSPVPYKVLIRFFIVAYRPGSASILVPHCLFLIAFEHSRKYKAHSAAKPCDTPALHQ